MNDRSLIRAESLGKKFWSGSRELVVFQDLWLDVCAGERLAIIGASGAGKSTLLHIIGGLDRPSNGKVYFENQEISSLSDKSLSDFRNRQLGFLWQNPSLLPEFSALENVMMPLLIRGVAYKTAAAEAGARLDEVGLKTREFHRSGELSGGEQQRVALARALVGAPKVLLADEPTGSLDHRTAEMISGLLSDLHRSHALTSIFVTHNLQFAFSCDRVLELVQGRLQSPSERDLQAAGVLTDATRLDGANYV